MPAQLANESFRADHVRFGNSVGAVVQVLMRSDIPAAEAFFRDHLRASPTGQKFRRPTGATLLQALASGGTLRRVAKLYLPSGSK